jgi:hypothetical protein
MKPLLNLILKLIGTIILFPILCMLMILTLLFWDKVYLDSLDPTFDKIWKKDK